MREGSCAVGNKVKGGERVGDISRYAMTFMRVFLGCGVLGVGGGGGGDVG